MQQQVFSDYVHGNKVRPMKRKIIGFYQDEYQDWAARLDCCHGQHVRHNPPFTIREWTQSEAGRNARLGTTLQCLKCDRLEWPDGLATVDRTPEFTDVTVPSSLTRHHTTTTGVWGRIHVLEGELLYLVNEPLMQETWLTPAESGVIAPGMRYAIKVDKPVRFYIEYYECGATEATNQARDVD